MQELVAGVERIRFDAEADLEQQQGAQLPPFPGECSSEDCPFPLADATAGTVGCPWYDQGFCRHGPLCRYKHTQRVMCANYLAGFCPEGPTCKFMHLKAALMMHGTDPAKGAECPQKPGVAGSTARRESGCKDVSPAGPLLLVTSTTQSLAVQPRDPRNDPPILQCPPEPGICFKCRQKGHYVGKCGKNQMEILLRKRVLSQGKQKEDTGRCTT
ncbi:LOW QUALITY PROTEIN: cleavage and polyadenylation specificity factor subunit 4-like [Numida meleagris]|uniref:LOW QUALITY PROTEIN: cleavage and polyadenylation specificity factor subunit 4-like n=1 Tax=Numida meleagris TaxID=8996 RepID=UPI000B3DDB20|nr:LOW QUALITY PROTEIN: cleavage and polyadenylation specificity factor subunit 4-like [Numida meleagris]